jgi:putative sigma-54 modulation protein
MRLELNIRGLSGTNRLDEAIDRRLRFALGRFSSRLRDVRADVGDLNGPRGGVDKYCLISVRTEEGHQLRARAVEQNVSGAIDRAADRISRIVSRHFHLRRSFSRESLRTAEPR